MIKVDSLTKVYPGGIVALDNVSFSVERNKIVGLLGPNGAGKTTTIRIITGYLSPTSGTVLIDGINISTSPIQAKAKIGYMPENLSFYPELTVWEYLEFRAYLKKIPITKIKSEINRVMELCFVSEVKNKLLANLSKGFRQRVGLADALLGDPEVIILDEPTIGLDPNQIVKVRQTIKQLRDAHTVIFSSHILSEVEAICDEVIIIHKGKILAYGTKEKLLGQLKQRQLYIEVTLPDPAPFIKWLEDEKIQFESRNVEKDWLGITLNVSRDIRELIFSKVIQLSGKLRIMQWQKSSLEDVFVELTTEAGEA